jgi:hypothetical protein
VTANYVAGKTVEENCKLSGTNKSALYRMLKTDAAQAMLSKAYSESMDRMLYHLPPLVNDAMNVLRKAMVEPWSVTPQAVAAANIVLNRVDKIEALLNKAEVPTANLGRILENKK